MKGLGKKVKEADLWLKAGGLGVEIDRILAVPG